MMSGTSISGNRLFGVSGATAYTPSLRSTPVSALFLLLSSFQVRKPRAFRCSAVLANISPFPSGESLLNNIHSAASERILSKCVRKFSWNFCPSCDLQHGPDDYGSFVKRWRPVRLN